MMHRHQGSISSLAPPASSAQIRSLIGSWDMELDNGVKIDLNLSQSGNIVFGEGKVLSGAAIQWAAASGSISGNILGLDVVPADGSKLYALSLDLGGQTSAKTYHIFSANTQTVSGTVKKVSYNIYE